MTKGDGMEDAKELWDGRIEGWNGRIEGWNGGIGGWMVG